MHQTKEDLENIKSKLIEHIKSSYEESKANELISRIGSMGDDEFVSFLKEQGILKENGQPAQNSQCIFCALASGEMPSTKIGENEKAISILELNPISSGHLLIIPKTHITQKENIPKDAYDLAKEMGEKIIQTFHPQDIKIIESEVMGHQIINVLPIYDNETIESPREKQTPEGLAELKRQIEDSQIQQIIVPDKKSEEIIEAPKKEINEKNTWLPRRIP